MKKDTVLFNTNAEREEFLLQLFHDQSELFGGRVDGLKYSSGPIDPAIAQRLIKKVQQTSDLLKKINIVLVPEKKGEKVGLSPTVFVASRTDTSSGTTQRQPIYLGSLDNNKYELFQTNYDTFIRFNTMSAWRYSAPEFRAKYMAVVAEAIGNAIVKVGWNGKTAEATTDRANNGVDVNRGWLEAIRQDAASTMLGAETTPAQVKIGSDESGARLPDADFATLDGFLFDLHMTRMHPAHQNSTGLVAVLGHELYNRHNLALYEQSGAATERNALQNWMSQQKCGGLPVQLEAFFPKRGVLITSYDNLSHYTQEESLIMEQEIEHKWDRVTNWRSSVEGFVVEQYERVAAAHEAAILLPDGNGGWA